MDGFNFLNIPDYQKRLDILAAITPFRPGMFIRANQDEIINLCDGQIEIAEEELKRWAMRHPEDGPQEIKTRIVGANPLVVKILDYDVDNILKNFHRYAVKNNITEEFIIDAFDKVRHPGIEIHEREKRSTIDRIKKLRKGAPDTINACSPSMEFLYKKMSKKYKSVDVLQNEDTIPSSNFLIKKIQRIKIDTALVASKNGCQMIFELINLLIKLLNYFFSSLPFILFPKGRNLHVK